MQQYDVVVVGAGISGLSFAHHAEQAGLPTLVLEAAAGPGGCLQRGGAADDFWFELGAHTCYNSYVGLIQLLERRALMPRVIPRHKVPFKLWADGQVQPIGRRLHWLELLLHLPCAPFVGKRDRTVQDYYSRLFGARNYAEVIGPALAAVPSQTADAFPAEMIFKRRTTRRKDLPRSFTFRGGLQTVIDAVASAEGIELRCDSAVRSLRRSERGLLLELLDGTSIPAPRVALAVPPDAAATMLQQAFPELAATLGQIRVTRVESLGVAVARTATTLPPLAGLLAVDSPFYSVVSRDTVQDPERRGFTFHFKPGLDEAGQLAEVVRVLGLPGPEAAQVVARRQVVLPSPMLGHAALVQQLDRALLATDGLLFLTGNYFAGLAIEDCVERSQAEIDRLLTEAMPRVHTSQRLISPAGR